MNLTPQELAKVRKVALHSVTLSSEMKTSVIDAKLRELAAEIKKKPTRKDEIFEIILVKLKIN